MASNPYATPESDVENFSGEVIKTSIWTKKGRLSVMSYLGQAMLMTIIMFAIIAAAIFILMLIFGVPIYWSLCLPCGSVSVWRLNACTIAT